MKFMKQVGKQFVYIHTGLYLKILLSNGLRTFNINIRNTNNDMINPPPSVLSGFVLDTDIVKVYMAQ